MALTDKQIYRPYWLYISILILMCIATFLSQALIDVYPIDYVIYLFLIVLSLILKDILNNQKTLQNQISVLEEKLNKR